MTSSDPPIFILIRSQRPPAPTSPSRFIKRHKVRDQKKKIKTFWAYKSRRDWVRKEENNPNRAITSTLKMYRLPARTSLRAGAETHVCSNRAHDSVLLFLYFFEGRRPYNACRTHVTIFPVAKRTCVPASYATHSVADEGRGTGPSYSFYALSVASRCSGLMAGNWLRPKNVSGTGSGVFDKLVR